MNFGRLVDFARSPFATSASRYIFVSVFVLLTLHFPIQHFTGLRLHWVAVLAFLPIAVLQTKPADGPSSRLLAIYVGLVALSAVLSLLLLPARSVLLGTLSYVLLPVTFYLGMQYDARARLRTAASANAIIALLAGVAAYYQLNHDSVLFGLYDGTKYEQLGMWGAPRAASLFFSPQIYAAYMAFSVVLHDITFRAGKPFPGVIVSLLVAFAFLSGSLSVVVGLAGYYLLKLAALQWTGRVNETLPRLAGYTVAILLVVSLQAAMVISAGRPTQVVDGAYDDQFQATQVERMLSAATGTGVAGDANTSRITVWRDIIEGTPFPFGHGVGSASTLVDGKDRPSTESYILSLYYQGGVVLLLAFAALTAAMLEGKPLTPQRTGFAAVFLVFAVVVPAYYAWALAIVWLLVFWFISGADSRSKGR